MAEKMVGEPKEKLVREITWEEPPTFQHVILPDDRLFDLKLAEIWQYRDLLLLFVRRDFVAKFKQTLLGPIWFLIQPILQTVMLLVVFRGMANLSTDGIPPVLFYLAGVTAWNYFANCLRATANTFATNAYIFGKVYFPRAIMPLSVVVSNLVQFGIGLGLFLLLYGYYFVSGTVITPNWTLLLLPLLVTLMGFMALGIGMIISALTTRYRDFQLLVDFGVQLLMYATPVIIPLSAVPTKYRPILLINPISGILETFKYGFFGKGVFDISLLMYSVAFTILIVLAGLFTFNRVEKNFMDSI